MIKFNLELRNWATWCLAWCIKNTKEFSKQVPITMFFERRDPKRLGENVQEQKIKKSTSNQRTPWKGISNETWTQTKCVHWNQGCITNSPSIYHGAPSRHQVYKDLFGLQESELDSEEDKGLANTIKAQSTCGINQSKKHQSHLLNFLQTKYSLQLILWKVGCLVSELLSIANQSQPYHRNQYKLCSSQLDKVCTQRLNVGGPVSSMQVSERLAQCTIQNPWICLTIRWSQVLKLFLCSRTRRCFQSPQGI